MPAALHADGHSGFTRFLNADRISGCQTAGWVYALIAIDCALR